MEIKLLSCPLCSVPHFENIVVLRNALVDITKRPIQCPVCPEQPLGLDKFTIHLFTHESSIENEYAATNAPAEESRTEEITNDSGGKNESEVVREGVMNNKDIRCDICHICFSDVSILEMHRNLLHTNGFSCHLCHKRFKMQGSLMVHMRVAHYGFGPSDVGADKPEPRKQENKQWECEVCLKKFTTKYFLKKHKRLHTGEMPYTCSLCSKQFTFQQSYHKHMLYHSTDKPHTCNECGRAFKELSTLHNHQRIHSGERPFACETCGKCFRQRVSYLVHKRIHTGAMPYKCTSCDKTFRYKVSQRTHKCKAEPPGAVVRQFGDLVNRLIQNQASKISEEERQQQEMVTITVEATPQNSAIASDFFGLVMSPAFQNTSENFETLCLASKDASQTNFDVNQCSTINEECFKQLLYNTSE